MFIHWGLYSLPAGEWKGQTYSGIGEWIMYKARIPIADYEQFARRFNPVKFDAEAWAQLAQDAGMKYLVLTAKHHDGFALYASQADPFNIVDATPFKRDVVKELAAACAKRGLKFGVYYSQAQDWTAPGGAIWEGPHEDDPVWANPIWDPRQAGEGVIPQPSYDMLRAVGRWLQTNGEAIYGAGRSPFGAEFGAYSPTRTGKKGKPVFEARRDWRCTTKPGKLYVHLFKWPAGRFELTGLKDRVTKGHLLADPQRASLKVTQQGDRVTIALPEKSPDPIAAVLCFDVAASPPAP